MTAALPSRALVRLALEVVLALGLAALIWDLWPRLDLPRLGFEEVWLALGWFILLAVPAFQRLWPMPQKPVDTSQTLGPETFAWGAYLLAGLFLALLVGGRLLGNYKLWLGIVYLGAVSLRLAGLTLLLRAALTGRQRTSFTAALAAAGISTLACLLLLPWVASDLVATWPFPLTALAPRLLTALLWGAVSGAVLFLLPLVGLQMRAAWMYYLAVALGPGPALSVTWFTPFPLAVALAILAGLIALRLGRRQQQRRAPEAVGLPLYWLLRAMLLVWWAVGAGIALSAAWWQPHLGGLFLESIWLRALGMGAFVVLCLGLLAEYSLPLLGGQRLLEVGGQYKVLGIILSALALLLMLSPILLTQPVSRGEPTTELFDRARAELIQRAVRLDPQHREVELKVPSWISGVSRIFIISQLRDGAEVEQGTALALLTAEDDLGRPHLRTLRAGVDTSDWALERRDVANRARHGKARLAKTWTVYTASGETFFAHQYFTGLYLGRDINQIKSVRLRYLYQNPPGRPPVVMQILRVFIY